MVSDFNLVAAQAELPCLIHTRLVPSVSVMDDITMAGAIPEGEASIASADRYSSPIDESMLVELMPLQVPWQNS